ncbi:type III secretion system ATPase SctN [Morganella psychrotolerans]
MMLDSFISHRAFPVHIQGYYLEAPLPRVFIGEICLLWQDTSCQVLIGRAQVVGFNEKYTLLSLIGRACGLTLTTVIAPTGERLTLSFTRQIPGSVIDPSGNTLIRLSEPVVSDQRTITRLISADAPDVLSRQRITEIIPTGVKALDGLLTCGKGQRLGIFAGAGCGKTVLMNMLIDHADADIFIIALIGERGREVTELIDDLQKSANAAKCILVCSTSDKPAIDRCNAALVATSLAEYYRDEGKDVVLFVDSLTRYGRALRDVALSAGELPVRLGFPASVFEQLPALLERPGATKNGVITAFYTVLLESEDEPDGFADEVRSILDGHIYLSRRLAMSNHYPAIDILASISRVMSQIASPEHLSAAGQFRHFLAKQKELKLLVELGEYKTGFNPDNDKAVALTEEMRNFLCQPPAKSVPLSEVCNALQSLTA